MRKMIFAKRFIPLLILILLSISAPAKFSERENPLASLDWLVGGEWKGGETIQVFEWGLEKHTIKAKSFVASDSGRRLVSEGHWYWHPKDTVIKGFFTATGMPFYMIESEADIDGKTLIHRLTTFSEGNRTVKYVETIAPVSDDSYHWKLFVGESPKGAPIFSDTFTRNSKVQNSDGRP